MKEGSKSWMFVFFSFAKDKIVLLCFSVKQPLFTNSMIYSLADKSETFVATVPRTQ